MNRTFTDQSWMITVCLIKLSSFVGVCRKMLKTKLKGGNDVYMKKMKSKLPENNVWVVWSGMKKITGFKEKWDQTNGNLWRANELTMFFNRLSSEVRLTFSSSASSRLCLLS